MVVCSPHTEALVKMRDDGEAFEMHSAAVAALEPYPNLSHQPLYAAILRAQRRSYSRAEKDRHGHTFLSSPLQSQEHVSSSDIRRRRSCPKTMEAANVCLRLIFSTLNTKQMRRELSICLRFAIHHRCDHILTALLDPAQVRH